MNAFARPLALLAALCGLSAARPATQSTECHCAANWTLSVSCPGGCSIVVYDLLTTNAACTWPGCQIIPSNVCTAYLSYAHSGSCSGGPYTIEAKSPCDGSGSNARRCPGGLGSVSLGVECASNCTQ